MNKINTDKNKEMSCIVDWLSFTILDTSKYTIDNIITDILQLDKKTFIKLDKGQHGYLSQIAYDNIRIFSDGLEGMGIHVQMSGSGCRVYEHETKGNWMQLFKYIKNFNVTRLDLAIDDKQEYLNMDILIQKTENREIVTQFRKYNIHKSGRFEDTFDGKTLYIGSSTSDIRIRIYDKTYEQCIKLLQNAKNDIEKSIIKNQLLTQHWIRCELQFRDELAKSMLNLLCEKTQEEYFEYIAGVLKDKIRYVDPSNDSNRRRWKESDFWIAFLEGIKKIKIGLCKKIKTFIDTLNHFEKQYAPTLATIFTFFEGDLEKIIEIIQRGKARMKKRHFMSINVTK